MVDGDPLTWETARNLLNRGINSAEDYNNISDLIDIDNYLISSYSRHLIKEDS